jgi:hypothetical protein
LMALVCCAVCLIHCMNEWHSCLYDMCPVTVYVVCLWSQRVCHGVMAGIALGAEICVMAAVKPMLC